MRELSLHVLDIAQNSLSAGAGLVDIAVEEDEAADRLTLRVADDGRGMTEEQVRRVTDPFYTTRTTRRVGLGIPLFRMAAEMAGGGLTVRSRPGEGTVVEAVFRLSHIDRPPLGDMNATVTALIGLNPGRDFRYRRVRGGQEFTLDTRELRKTLDGVPLDHPEVAAWIRDYLREQTDALTG